MAQLFDVAAKHRAAVLAGDRQAAGRLVESYGAAWQAVQQDLDTLLSRVEMARAEGITPSPAWLYQETRLRNLLAQTERRVAEFAADASLLVQDQQRDLIAAAQQHAGELVEVGLDASAPGFATSFVRLPQEAFEQLVGHLADGSPLAALLAELPDAAGRDLRDALLSGVARGENPRRVAASVREAMGGQLSRALTIARTEQLRAYREASRLAYEANSDVVAGWTWQAAGTSRTCAQCWAMHGTRHPVTERLDGHPNCRCSMVPLTKTWAELGAPDVPETRVELDEGPNLFDELDEADQLAVLGRAKLDAYQRGEISLRDLVGRRDSDAWGTTRYERSLKEIRAERAAGGHTASFRIGDGITPPASRAELERAEKLAQRRARRAADRDALDFGDLTDSQIAQGRRDLKAVRAQARAEAERVREEVRGWFERQPSMWQLQPPATRTRWVDPITGRVEFRSTSGGGWDWFYGLGDDEQKRLRRSWLKGSADAASPDEVAEMLSQMVGRELSTDEAMELWLEQTRRFDAAGALARGKVPAAGPYGGMDVDTLLGDEFAADYRVTKVFDAEDAAVRYLAETHAELAADYAARMLPPAQLGPNAYELTFEQWQREVSTLEDILGDVRPIRDDEWGPVYDPDDQELIDRWNELVPSGIDPDNTMPLEELYRRIVDVARTAGLIE